MVWRTWTFGPAVVGGPEFMIVRSTQRKDMIYRKQNHTEIQRDLREGLFIAMLPSKKATK